MTVHPARLLGALAQVPPWMVRPVLRIAAWHFVFVAGVTAVKSGTNAVFLARATPTLLPFLYVCTAVVVLLVTGFLARLLARRPPASLMTGATVLASGLVLGLAGLVALDVPLSAGALYVAGEVAATSVSVLFWARLADAFSLRNQRRALGLVGAGGMAGAVVGGLLMSGLVGRVGVLAPLATLAVAPVLALPLLAGLRSRSRRELDAGRQSFGGAVRYLAGRGFPRTVALLVVLLAATGAATDFAFRLEASVSADEAAMASLFGLLNAGVGVAVVAFQTALTGRLLGRLGLFAFAGLVPSVLLVTSLAHVVWPRFEILCLLKGVEMAGAFSLYGAAISLLYNPMPGGLRSQVRTLTDGAVKKAGAAAAGLVLGGLAAWRPELFGTWMVAVLAGSVLLVLRALRGLYLGALGERLGTRQRRDPQTPLIDPTDRETFLALCAALDDDDEDRVLHALDALGESFALFPDRLVTLLSHRDERVRMEALKHIAAREDPELTAALLVAIEDEQARRPRSEAIRCLQKTAGADAADLAARFLDDEDPGAACAAIEVCLGDHEHGPEARRRLDAVVGRLRELQPAFRREVARLLGRVPDRRYDAALTALLDDELTSVRRLAIDAAAHERHEAHLPPLVATLRDRELRADARRAIAAYGDRAVPALAQALDATGGDIDVRIHIPRVLSSIGTEDAARALVHSSVRDDAYLQLRVADRLLELATVRPEVVRGVGQNVAGDAVLVRLRLSRAYALAIAELSALDEVVARSGARARRSSAFLTRVLEDRRRQNLRIGLILLGLTYGVDRMLSTFRGLARARGEADDDRQNALEMLDVALSGSELRGAVFELLEPASASGVLPMAGDPEEEAQRRLEALCRNSDPMIRALARRLSGALGAVALADGLSFRAVAPGTDELQAEDMPDDVVDRLLFLENVDLFEGLGTDDLAAIAAICTELTFPPEEPIYTAGEVGDCLYVVVDGAVRLFREGRQLMALHPGESLGQVSFLDRGPRPVDARAGPSPVRLLRVERGAFLDLLTDRPGLMHAFFGVIAARLRTLIEA